MSQLSNSGAVAVLLPAVAAGGVFVVLAASAGTPLTSGNTGLICGLLAFTTFLVVMDLVGPAQRPGYSPGAQVLGIAAIPIASLLAARTDSTSWLFIWWVILLVGGAAIAADFVWCLHRSRGRVRPEPDTDESRA